MIIIAAHVVKQRGAGGIGDIVSLAGAAADVNYGSSGCNIVVNRDIVLRVGYTAAGRPDEDISVGVIADVVGDPGILQHRALYDTSDDAVRWRAGRIHSVVDD